MHLPSHHAQGRAELRCVFVRHYGMGEARLGRVHGWVEKETGT